ncbi:hypothetical protein [Ruminococcus sp. YE282]|uniref:hypothetical protein n=1 Tax=Ruminococcus sp. YE282 TaxID=3158780 RepID=UPI000B89DD5D
MRIVEWKNLASIVYTDITMKLKTENPVIIVAFGYSTIWLAVIVSVDKSMKIFLKAGGNTNKASLLKIFKNILC